MISAFDDGGTRSDQADWLEVSLWMSGKSDISSANLLQVLGFVEEQPEFGDEFDSEVEEALDAEILEPKSEKLVAAVWAELSYRADRLGDAYPFEVEAVGQGFLLSLRTATSVKIKNGHRAYVACLLTCAARKALIIRLAKKDELLDLESRSAHVLQILAVKSAAHFVAGDAYWFGWPRIDDAKVYAEALRKLVGLLGHGELKKSQPDWSTDAEKDGTVDVVSWRSFPDRRYGSLIIYGQVASGKNWQSKPIGSFITGYFHDWFEDDPAHHWLPAIFIPFNLHEEARERRKSTVDDVAVALSRRHERTFGIVFDRLRITNFNYVDEEEDCSEDAQHMHESARLIAEIDQWIADISEYGQRGSIKVGSLTDEGA